MGQPQKVNQSDNDSSEHTDNENDYFVRARAEIPFDDFIDAMDGNSEDDDDYAASPVPQSTDDDNLDVCQTSGDEEVSNANLLPLRRTRAELQDDSNDETSTESEVPDLPVIQRRRLLEEELETEAESSETDSLAPQDPNTLEILNILAPTAKKNQKDNRKSAIRLINPRINQKAKDYDPLVPEVDLSSLKITIPPKIVESEKTLWYKILIKNLVIEQNTNILAAEAIFQKRKLEAAEHILDTFELKIQLQQTSNFDSIYFVSDGIGARLQRYQATWKQINANKILEKGVQANWIHPDAPNPLLQNQQYLEFQGKIQENMTYQQALDEEIKQGIVKKIKKEEVLFLNRAFIIPRKDKSEYFKTVTRLSLINDWATVIDIHSVYNHIQVAKELQQIMAFAFNHQTYTYIGMPLGLKTAPFIFNKHLLPAVLILRKEGILVVVYFDDILILCQDPTLLHLQTNKQFKYWRIQDGSLILSRNSNDRRKKKKHVQQITQMEQKIHQRTNSSYTRAGKDYTKASILQTKTSSNFSTYEASLQDINICIKTVSFEQLSKAESQTQTRLELELINDQKKFSPTLSGNSTLSNSNNRRIQTRMVRYISDNQSKYRDQQWRQMEKEMDPQTRNQRELADVLCALLRFGHQLQEEKIHSIPLRTDITTKCFNINRKISSRTLSNLTDQTLQLAESLQIQQKAINIPVRGNQTADSLSRLNKAEDDHLKKRIAEQIFKTTLFFPTIDLFANRKTMLTKRYCAINFDQLAVARDAFSIIWKAEQLVIHSPIPLIGHCLQRIKQEKIAALMILPN
ncbi:MAG: hypothetical protein EZS28_019509 [Streblomastix strix]|uniref:Reverse transcriptase domain-containing protein n=1 Tax=Streblomastix strix TaxID=222440 RepID=A0A5J4VR25_9EUKA|nr:MAG: hypothetical protein EZS28_019509 [Streblomastix strix]